LIEHKAAVAAPFDHVRSVNDPERAPMNFPSRLGSHAGCLGRMLRCCGVDPARLAHDGPGPGFIVLARACMACTQVEACRRWLDAAAPDSRREPPDFCPNAERLRGAAGTAI
jgi:hypothetical protein